MGITSTPNPRFAGIASVAALLLVGSTASASVLMDVAAPADPVVGLSNTAVGTPNVIATSGFTGLTTDPGRGTWQTPGTEASFVKPNSYASYRLLITTVSAAAASFPSSSNEQSPGCTSGASSCANAHRRAATAPTLQAIWLTWANRGASGDPAG